jgi:DNA polymerase delta subunit 4
MPPRRSTGRNASARSQQATLSFGAKSRITKPSASTAQGKKTKDVEQISSATPLDTSLPEQAPVPPPATSSKPHVAEVAVQNQAEEELEKPQTAEDRKALKVPEAELKRYWNAEERKRKAPRGQSFFARGTSCWLAVTTYSPLDQFTRVILM